MDYSGNKAPMTVPNKGMWMMQHDLPRASRLFDGTHAFLVPLPGALANSMLTPQLCPPTVPLILHDNFPAPTFRAQALLRIIKDQDRARFLPAVETLFESTWGHSDVPLATLDNLKDILRPLYRQEEAKLSDLIAASNSQENKARMKQEAQDLAESKGAFGVPWIIVTRHDGEEGIFFGSDRLEVRTAPIVSMRMPWMLMPRAAECLFPILTLPTCARAATSGVPAQAVPWRSSKWLDAQVIDGFFFLCRDQS